MVVGFRNMYRASRVLIQEHSETLENQSEQKSKRLLSLDAFRGLTILGMLLVNNIALDTATPRHFQHARWGGGVNFADMVFPWFLFIVGVAIPYAFASHKKKGLSTVRYYLRAFNRMIALVFLGCLIDSSIAKTPIFDLGVLQLIGLAYFVAALLYRLPSAWRLSVAMLFLLAHWALIRFVPIPGVGSGVFSESQNIIKHINDVYLGAYHLSGLISVIPTSALVLVGTAVGDLLRCDNISNMRKMTSLFAGGLVLVVLGLVWNIDLPFNKPVWTPSYILFTAGWASGVLAVLYYIIDVLEWKAWAFPLVVYGSNAIVAYVLPILVKVFILWEWHWTCHNGSVITLQTAFLRFFTVHMGKITGGWIYTISYLAFWWLILLWLRHKKIYLRV